MKTPVRMCMALNPWIYASYVCLIFFVGFCGSSCLPLLASELWASSAPCCSRPQTPAAAETANRSEEAAALPVSRSDRRLKRGDVSVCSDVSGGGRPDALWPSSAARSSPTAEWAAATSHLRRVTVLWDEARGLFVCLSAASVLFPEGLSL